MTNKDSSDTLNINNRGMVKNYQVNQSDVNNFIAASTVIDQGK